MQWLLIVLTYRHIIFFDLKLTKCGIISHHNRVDSVLVMSFFDLGHVQVSTDLLQRLSVLSSVTEQEECNYEC
jgi:hypothetical protein